MVVSIWLMYIFFNMIQQRIQDILVGWVNQPTFCRSCTFVNIIEGLKGATLRRYDVRMTNYSLNIKPSMWLANLLIISPVEYFVVFLVKEWSFLYSILRLIHTARKRNRKRQFSLMFEFFSLISFTGSLISFPFRVCLRWAWTGL